MHVNFELPVKVISEMNWRGHWTARARRLKHQKGITYANCMKYLGFKPKDNKRHGRFHVTLTRLKGYRERDFDGDNLQGAFKAVRDGIAMYLGIDDGSDLIEWEYRQDKDKAAGVRVEIVRIDNNG